MTSHSDFKPILFKPAMVQAIFSGQKYMTRRVAKPQPQLSDLPWMGWYIKKTTNSFEVNDLAVAYGYRPGQVLWVRETFTRTDGKYIYYANTQQPETLKWKPAIHMPKADCRLFLLVNDVHLEHLQDITPEDAKAEGIAGSGHGWHDYTGKYQILDPGVTYDGLPAAVYSFRGLWDSINAQRGHGWDTNPWVLRIRFDRIEKPADFK